LNTPDSAKRPSLGRLEIRAVEVMMMTINPRFLNKPPALLVFNYRAM